MSELNQKMLSEFLELMKRVSTIEKNQESVILKNETLLQTCTSMIQNVQNHIDHQLKNQNTLVQNTNDNLANQVNQALKDSSAETLRIMEYKLQDFQNENKIKKIEEKLCSHQRTLEIIEEVFCSFSIKNKKESKELLKTHIGDLELLTRTYRCLQSESIQTLEDLMKWSLKDLRTISNLGRKGIEDIMNRLKELGLKLNDY